MRVAADGQALELDADGRTVAISSPGKVIFPEHGETKLDLVRYYLAVGEPLMRTVGDRPMLLQRFPNGATGKSFFQKRIPESAPGLAGDDDRLDAQRHDVAGARDRRPRPRALGGQPRLPRLPRVAATGRTTRSTTDELRLDLDPRPASRSRWCARRPPRCAGVARRARHRAYPKTTGNRGLHVYVRLEPGWDSIAVRSAAVAVARELERRRPDLITAAWWKEERGARVFIDFNQNAPHKTVFAPWSVRARVGAQVSTPFAWDELAAIEPDELTIATVPARVARLGDPWAAIDDEPQSLEPLLERYRADLAAGLLDAPWPPVYPKMPDEPPRVAPSRARKPEGDATG